nr:uncharacterized mitochondrial protein AtMg00810-like [Tanacetum cinerariifolium]
MGKLTFFLGLQVKQKQDEIFISQDKYVAEILKKFGLTDRKSASTPIDTEKPLLKDPDGEDVDVHTYRSMIGSLMYLTSSRPDIMFAVCACARFQVSSKASHLHAVKRIFRYLKGKPHLGLWYPKDSPFNLVTYSDSDYVGASLDRKSPTGGCQFLGCRLISWQCKKQTVVATLSTKAEYVAAARGCIQTGRIIAKIDADKDVILEEVDAKKDAEVAKKDATIQGRQEESQTQVYHIDLEHEYKLLSMQDDELEPAELKEVIEVVTTTKLMTKVVTATATTITAATITAAPSVTKRRKGVVIRDPKETATSSTIVHFEPKSKDKGKGILVQEPKPLKKQAHIEQDEAYARELEAELNKSKNWDDDLIVHIKRKEKQDNVVLRYQALKRKPQTKAQAKKNMMVYLKNMVGFKMNFFKGMSYDDIRPIFEKHFNSIVGFLEKGEE